ncbi:hypothetical protein BDW62DRAFT_55592 [Aspergillus aurantiobrunneus]
MAVFGQDDINELRAMFSESFKEQEMKQWLSDLFTRLYKSAPKQLSDSEEDKHLARALGKFTESVLSPLVDITSALPLVRLTLRAGTSSAHIWTAARSLMSALYQNPPVIGVEKSAKEINRRYFKNVLGLYKRFFARDVGRNVANTCCEQAKRLHDSNGWKGWPNPPHQGPFSSWFLEFQNTVLQNLPYQFRVFPSKETGRFGNRPPVFLVPASVAEWDYSWSNILVIGEQQPDDEDDESIRNLIRLYSYAREVFISQPGRRFMHAFTICGSLMRLYMFDRSGAYSSESFHIHIKPRRFVRVLAGYASMTQADLGLNTFVQTDGRERFIICDNRKIILDDEPLAKKEEIFNRGTTCFRAKPHDGSEWVYVVKFTWLHDQCSKEGELLRQANGYGVKGIPSVICYQNVEIDGRPDTIHTLRRGLKFVPLSIGDGEGLDSTQDLDRPHSIEPGWRPESSKRQADHVSAQQSKTPRLGDNTLSPLDDETTTSDSPNSDNPTGEFRVGVHHCIVISPLGHPLSECRSDIELLTVIRDCIEAHESLFTKCSILHRDISYRNLVMVQNKDGQPEGCLIDFDMSDDLSSNPEPAYMKGIPVFMAIGALQGAMPTYRHDLESFLYVLLFACTRPDRQPSTNRRWKEWCDSFQSNHGKAKLHLMDKDAFEYPLEEFTEAFERLKPVARNLHSTLFKDYEGPLYTGTPADSSRLYGEVLGVINSALKDLQEANIQEREETLREAEQASAP